MSDFPQGSARLLVLRIRRHGPLHCAVYWLLIRPTLHRTRDRARAEASTFPYRPDWKHADGYRLTPLGVLHRLTGLVIHLEGDR